MALCKLRKFINLFSPPVTPASEEPERELFERVGQKDKDVVKRQISFEEGLETPNVLDTHPSRKRFRGSEISFRLANSRLIDKEDE